VALAPTPKRPRGWRDLLQHRHDRLSGDADRPSYAGQIFTSLSRISATSAPIWRTSRLPRSPPAGLVVKQDVTEPSNWRRLNTSMAGLRARHIAGIAGVDTRACDHARPAMADHRPGVLGLSRRRPLRSRCLAHSGGGVAGIGRDGSGTGSNLSPAYDWDESAWAWPTGFGRQTRTAAPRRRGGLRGQAQHSALPCRGWMPVTVVPATASGEDILRHQPDGVFLSNGPRAIRQDRGNSGSRRSRQ